MKKSVVVKMQQDFEARPIANLVQVASSYESTIYVQSDNKKINAKSIMGMMSLALLNGEEILVDAEGADEAEAVAAIEEFLVS